MRLSPILWTLDVPDQLINSMTGSGQYMGRFQCGINDGVRTVNSDLTLVLIKFMSSRGHHKKHAPGLGQIIPGLVCVY